MSIQNLTLIVAGAINLIMSILVFSRGVRHSKINLYFSFLTFFNFLWAIGLWLSRSFTDLDLTSIFARSTYVSAIAIVISLLYFVVHFPNKIKVLSIKLKFIVWLPAIFLVFIIYSKLFITHFVNSYSEYEYISYFYKPFYWVYFVYFISIALLSLYFLWQKYKVVEGLFKKQVKFLFLAILVAFIFGVHFDLFLLYFGDFRFNWLGPIFTVFINACVFYFIFPKQEK
ncbi:MAG: histidine kinase N-terminal 7TM domain-containing protein [Patescibacteria group bacterium]|jgi:hypothetical protein